MIHFGGGLKSLNSQKITKLFVQSGEFYPGSNVAQPLIKCRRYCLLCVSLTDPEDTFPIVTQSINRTITGLQLGGVVLYFVSAPL